MLRRIAGPQAAIATVLFGEILDGAEAERVGLAWKCVDDDKLMTVAHEMAARASVVVTADHDQGLLRFRLAGVNGLETVHTEYRTGQIGPAVLDELAKLIVGQPSHFL